MQKTAGIIIAALIISGTVVWMQLRDEELRRCEAMWASMSEPLMLSALDRLTDFPAGEKRFLAFTYALQEVHGIAFPDCSGWQPWSP